MIALVGMTVLAASGCGSSSEGQRASNEGEPVDSGIDGEEGGHRFCNPIFGDLCPADETCCFSGIRGACTKPEACTAPFQIACLMKANCTGDAVCCATASFPSALDTTSRDASGFGIVLACQSACAVAQAQLCLFDSDCASGEVCGDAFGAGVAGIPFVRICTPVADAGAPATPDAGEAAATSAPDASAPDGSAPDASARDTVGAVRRQAGAP
jgi:hypothetical protein